MRIAIVGARYPASGTLQRVHEFVRQLPAGTVIISGLAIGVDTAAHEAALECGLCTDAHIPGPRIYPVVNTPLIRRIEAAGGKITFQPVFNPYIRNIRIVQDCDKLIAFDCRPNSGTANTVAYARKIQKPVEIINAAEIPDL